MAKITVTADRGVSAETLAIAADAVREALRGEPTKGENGVTVLGEDGAPKPAFWPPRAEISSIDFEAKKNSETAWSVVF